MRLMILGAIAPLMLAGCWGAPPNEKILAEGCTTLFTEDQRMMQNLLSEGSNLTVDGFCACYASTAAADPAATDLHKDVLNAINTTRDETGLGVEAAVDHIEEAKEDPAEFSTFTMQELDDVGDYLQELAQDMSEAGMCPTA